MPDTALPITRLYVTPDSRELPPHLHLPYEALLGQNERDRLNRYQGRRRAEYLVGRATLRTALSQTSSLGLAPSSWEILERPDLPPDIPQAREEGWHFSLSHSRGVVAVLVTNAGPCGVDIEFHQARANIVELAEHGFHPDEATQLRCLPEPEKLVYFYQLWSLKEAFIKASGSVLFSDRMARTRFAPTADEHDGANAGDHGATDPPNPRGYWQNLNGFSLAMVAGRPARQVTTGFPLAEQALSNIEPTCFNIITTA